jgi:hypothetical protein
MQSKKDNKKLTRLVTLVNNHIGRCEIGIQMLLSPFEYFFDSSVMEHNTKRRVDGSVSRRVDGSV